ncbi:odorant receptor 131-2-like [Brachionichthys hirsutus]|uniref:odorant receptor 131-2-like n=1 Tax=Brachionichthys hirsutus TaxID=412623 RepID=UPI0036051654
MAVNSSETDFESSQGKVGARFIIIQVLVVLFLWIDLLLIITFCMRAFFYTNMRYILFAVTLLSDSLFLLVSDILFILIGFNLNIQTRLCAMLYIISSQANFVTIVTLTAMVLERYVAICLPLRHAELCSTRNTLLLILIINGLSSLPCIIFLSIFFASATRNFYTQVKGCHWQIFVMHEWQNHLKSAINQFYFLVIGIIIVVCYFKIMKVAKAASGESRKSTWKGLRTIILHALQLLLCVIQLWCTFVESVVFKINISLFINVRYFNYVTFILAPRCLSPLIYGVRDETFLQAFKHYVLCGLCKKAMNLF